MNVLVVGGGGREHALAWKVAQSQRVERVFVAPGNAGTALEPKVENLDIGAEDIAKLLEFAADQAIELTIVGPEAPLCAGMVDSFEAAGLACFGPRKAAAAIEGSKSLAKEFMRKYRIPTADYASFTRLDEAGAYLERCRMPIVIKADGLAAGKGVVIAEDRGTALDALSDMLSGGVYGEAGRRVVVEEFVHGEEASFIVMADGEHILPLASSQDHKPRDVGDKGPNTGGMGAYSPAPLVTDALQARIMREVIEPAVAGLKADGNPYVGFLYAGLMIRPDGTPSVLEFNCRLGDPETQPIMLRLQSDLTELCLAALQGTLHRCNAVWDERVALGVVLASEGYPGSYRKGDAISGLQGESDPLVKLFHAGTATDGDDVTTAGGRVLSVCALGGSVRQARQRAYDRVAGIDWDGMFYRSDIGHRALAKA